jgi:hypothetical protein
MTTPRAFFTLATLAPLAFAACAGSDAESSTTVISASDGGSVQIAGSETRLVIAAGALPVDTEISLEMAATVDFPALEDVVGNVASIEPTLVLQIPATLLVALGDDVGPSTVLSARQLIEGEWFPAERPQVTIGSGGIASVTLDFLAPVAFVEATPR